MKCYKIPLQEEVRVWQDVTAVVYTEDNLDEVYKSIENGDFMFKYGFDDILHEEFLMETVENIQYSYEFTKKENIEVIEK